MAARNTRNPPLNEPLREPTNWRCPDCGYTTFAEFRSPVDFSVLMGCAACGSWMDRLDRLGELEAELSEVRDA